MPLQNRTTLPPGGWVFEIRGNNRELLRKFKSMGPWNDAVKEIVEIRKANQLAGADYDSVSAELDQYTCERLGFDPAWVDVKKKSSSERRERMPLAQVAAVVGRAVSAFKAYKDGSIILREWFGAGAQPVPHAVAVSRSQVCYRNPNQKCEFNQPGFAPVEAVSEVIRQQAEKKNELSLHVPDEEHLHTCQLCTCPLKLKVHVPIVHVSEQLPKAIVEGIREKAPWCWMIKEIDQL